ncbi:MAG: c-type cytochrome [Nitrospirota bacterium]|nr:c-type cytochrome [Nitrospirota bacterium]
MKRVDLVQLQRWLGVFLFALGTPLLTFAADPEVLKPRVPVGQIEEAKSWKNPISFMEENIEKGKHIFHGKAFCVTCHGRDGKGLGNIPGLVGKLPRNFTDKTWQAARTDGELFWILKNGSPGTDMASFIPLVLTEDEAWHVILYVRSFGNGVESRKE